MKLISENQRTTQRQLSERLSIPRRNLQRSFKSLSMIKRVGPIHGGRWEVTGNGGVGALNADKNANNPAKTSALFSNDANNDIEIENKIMRAVKVNPLIAQSALANETGLSKRIIRRIIKAGQRIKRIGTKKTGRREVIDDGEWGCVPVLSLPQIDGSGRRVKEIGEGAFLSPPRIVSHRIRVL